MPRHEPVAGRDPVAGSDPADGHAPMLSRQPVRGGAPLEGRTTAPRALASRGMRIAATALFVGGPLAFLSVAAVNLVTLGETRAAIERRAVEMAPLRARIGRLAGPGAPDESAIYLPGASPALAGAALQARLSAILTASGAAIAAFQPEPAEGPGDIRLRVTFEANNGQMLDTLTAIETTLPLLKIDALSMTASPVAGEATPGEPRLRVELVVRGFRPEDAV
ncbi:type II secretion system protein GspM [Acuticoccus yangtzensis]|uniref:type II secretion system protein GspM n=1 Tax=Acuticoccus yangtzensis TaxID=1443441 RepID=UPI00130078AA|nr:type II secretion system protein GspM [Acuticoccus yangtzensis]